MHTYMWESPGELEFMCVNDALISNTMMEHIVGSKISKPR